MESAPTLSLSPLPLPNPTTPSPAPQSLSPRSSSPSVSLPALILRQINASLSSRRFTNQADALVQDDRSRAEARTIRNSNENRPLNPTPISLFRPTSSVSFPLLSFKCSVNEEVVDSPQFFPPPLVFIRFDGPIPRVDLFDKIF